METQLKSVNAQLRASNDKLSDSNNTVKSQQKKIESIQNDLKKSTSRLTEMDSKVKAMQTNIEKQSKTISELSVGKEYTFMKLSDACHKETRLRIVATQATYANEGVLEKFNSLLEDWYKSESAAEPFTMRLEALKSRAKETSPDGSEFKCEYTIFRGDHQTRQTRHWSFLGHRNSIAKSDFHRALLCRNPRKNNHTANLIATLDRNRFKGINFMFSDCVGADENRALTWWDTVWVNKLEVDEYDMVTEIVFYKGTASTSTKKAGIVGLSVKTKSQKNPVLIGKSTANFQRCTLKGVERIVGAELRGGKVSGYNAGQNLGLTAAWFWTNTGVKWGFDLEQNQASRQKWSGPAPVPGYVLKGLWGGSGEILERVGLVWGIDAPLEERFAEELAFCQDYESLDNPWKRFVDIFKRPDWKMSNGAGTTTKHIVQSPIGEVTGNSSLENMTVYQGSNDLQGIKLDFEGKAILLGATSDATVSITSLNFDEVVGVAIACAESPAASSNIVPIRIQVIGRAGAIATYQAAEAEWVESNGLKDGSAPTLISSRPDKSWSFKGFAVQHGEQMISSMAVLWGKN